MLLMLCCKILKVMNIAIFDPLYIGSSYTALFFLFAKCESILISILTTFTTVMVSGEAVVSLLYSAW